MFLAKIEPSQLSVLSETSTTTSLVQLASGGTAVLSAPSAPLLSGKLLRLIVTGRVEISSGGANPNATIYLGTSTSSPILVNLPGVALGTTSGSGSLVSNFVSEVNLVWDSVSQQVIQSGNNTTLYSIPSQSDLVFCVGGAKGSGGDPTSTLTITEFKLELV